MHDKLGRGGTPYVDVSRLQLHQRLERRLDRRQHFRVDIRRQQSVLRHLPFQFGHQRRAKLLQGIRGLRAYDLRYIGLPQRGNEPLGLVDLVFGQRDQALRFGCFFGDGPIQLAVLFGPQRAQREHGGLATLGGCLYGKVCCRRPPTCQLLGSQVARSRIALGDRQQQDRTSLFQRHVGQRVERLALSLRDGAGGNLTRRVNGVMRHLLGFVTLLVDRGGSRLPHSRRGTLGRGAHFFSQAKSGQCHARAESPDLGSLVPERVLFDTAYGRHAAVCAGRYFRPARKAMSGPQAAGRRPWPGCASTAARTGCRASTDSLR